MEYKFKEGDRVIHQEGNHGHVIKDQDSDGLVKWKSTTEIRISHFSALTKNDKPMRWRS
jgi:preprotein translocase subunit YajC